MLVRLFRSDHQDRWGSSYKNIVATLQSGIQLSSEHKMSGLTRVDLARVYYCGTEAAVLPPVVFDRTGEDLPTLLWPESASSCWIF